ncbi:hypothetical protein GPA27_06160 [Aromatoleum toluolicum]|uniref:Methyl-accepting chemotaxis protein n=1 Tax=Aromatoleum toluolicum TaxID=90060 RepID=A0ABX1NCF2_9RHOO|nr:hypothetical protein [Aromatoleum toluolicum]NMF96967.1 hypothetical protein [Aromatoleum toluolicum]
MADEVRKLVERTSGATGEIVALVTTMQEGIRGTREQMGAACAQVAQAVAETSDTQKEVGVAAHDLRELATAELDGGALLPLSGSAPGSRPALASAVTAGKGLGTICRICAVFEISAHHARHRRNLPPRGPGYH